MVIWLTWTYVKLYLNYCALHLRTLQKHVSEYLLWLYEDEFIWLLHFLRLCIRIVKLWYTLKQYKITETQWFRKEKIIQQRLQLLWKTQSVFQFCFSDVSTLCGSEFWLNLTAVFSSLWENAPIFQTIGNNAFVKNASDLLLLPNDLT